MHNNNSETNCRLWGDMIVIEKIHRLLSGLPLAIAYIPSMQSQFHLSLCLWHFLCLSTAEILETNPSTMKAIITFSTTCVHMCVCVHVHVHVCVCVCMCVYMCMCSMVQCTFFDHHVAYTCTSMTII